MKIGVPFLALITVLGISCTRPAAAVERYVVGSIQKTSQGLSVGQIKLLPVSSNERQSLATCFSDNLCEVKVDAPLDGGKARYITVVDPGRFSSPKQLLDFLYKRVALWDANTFYVEDVDAAKLYTIDLADLVVQANRKAAREEEESPASSPWKTAQEWDVRGVKIEVDDLDAGSALGIVRYRNLVEEDLKPTTVTYELRETAEGWRIADIVSPSGAPGDIGSLSDELKTYVRAVPSASSSASPTRVGAAAPTTSAPKDQIIQQIFGGSPVSDAKAATSGPPTQMRPSSVTSAVSPDPLNRARILIKTSRPQMVDLGTFRQLSERLHAKDGECKASPARPSGTYDIECSYNFRTYSFTLQGNRQGQLILLDLEMDAKRVSAVQRANIIRDVLQ